jgi:hypothetical protein
MPKKSNRFTLQPSQKPGYHVCTDTVNRIVCVFKDHDFNLDQSFTVLDDFQPDQVNKLPTIAREMGDWLRENHYNIVF